MTKTKSTKRAVLVSGLALLLCVSMFIGTTFAWFTDSVSSVNNIIKSGNLDVELYWSTDPADADSWNLVDTDTNVFSNQLWEPGHTEVVYLKVVNEGSLALKYQLGINIFSEVGSKNVNGKEFKLSDYIYYDAIESEENIVYATREAARKAVVEPVQIKTAYADNSELYPKDTDGKLSEEYVALVVYMPEEVGNDANYAKGEAVPTITLGINLVATQYTYESDSYDDQYDANLETSENGISRVLDDGSTVFYYNEESDYYGRVRLTALPENLGSEYVVPAEVNDLGGALVGVTLDKLTVPAGIQYAYKSLEGATIEKVILEEGTIIVPNRMFYKVNVDSVEIPSSVTTIEESAFQQVNLSELLLPANVETFGVHAFAGSTLEKITFEGSNLIFDNRPMRECQNLKTVIFNCFNVTFMNSTTNGDCWISNTGSNGSGYSHIEFYVKNETVAAKVREAIKYENPETTPIYVDEQLFVNVKSITEFQAELDAATVDTIINLTDNITGDVTFTQKDGVSLVLNGNNYIMNGSINITARATINNPATLTIKNFNFVTTETSRNFIFSSETNRYPNNLTISNCTFEGTGPDSNVVPIKVKSANNLVIENCKANNVHSLLQNDRGGWNYTIKNCVATNAGRGISLNSVQGAIVENVVIEASDSKYGIRIDAEYDDSVIITDCKISAFCPIVVRNASKTYAVVFNGTNTMTAANTDGIWCAIGTTEYETNGSLPTAATGSVTITLNDAGLDANGIYGAAN